MKNYFPVLKKKNKTEKYFISRIDITTLITFLFYLLCVNTKEMYQLMRALEKTNGKEFLQRISEHSPFPEGS